MHTVQKALHAPTGTPLAHTWVDEWKASEGSLLEELGTLRGAMEGHLWPQAAVVRFYGMCSGDDKLGVLTEWMDAGSFADVLKRVGRVPEPVCRTVCGAALDGLAALRSMYARSQRTCTRTPTNSKQVDGKQPGSTGGDACDLPYVLMPHYILLTTAGTVKLECPVSQLLRTRASHGLGNRCGMGMLERGAFMPPESITGTGKNDFETKTVWRMGALLMQLATGTTPIVTMCDAAGSLPVVQLRAPTVAMFHGGSPGTAVGAGASAGCTGQPEAITQPLGELLHTSLFSILAQIVSQPPPRLPSSTGMFSEAFRAFTAACCNKDPHERPRLLSGVCDAPWLAESGRADQGAMYRWALSTVGCTLTAWRPHRHMDCSRHTRSTIRLMLLISHRLVMSEHRHIDTTETDADTVKIKTGTKQQVPRQGEGGGLVSSSHAHHQLWLPKEIWFLIYTQLSLSPPPPPPPPPPPSALTL